MAVTLLMAGLFSCASGQQEREFSHSLVRQIDRDTAVTTDKRIDGAMTYLFNFRIKGNPDCIKVGIQAVYNTDTLPTKKLPAKVYFIVEKTTDISRFKLEQKELFTLLGQNFTTQWDQQPSIIICDSDNDPLLSLNPGDRYRIRYSALSDKAFSFTVTVRSDSEIMEGP